MTRLHRIGLMVFLLLVGLGLAHAEETRLLRFPDLSANQVVFVYAGDLWIAARDGGGARRLTAHPGDEVFPKFSPDGKWIAFTGDYDGNSDVFVIPAEGGEPRRLTFHPARDEVMGWTPDGTRVLFRSARSSKPPEVPRLFLVSPDGGLPEALPMPRGSLSSFSPDGTKIAYNPLSREFRTWKRYRGGLVSYIGVYDLKTDTYRELPRSGANDTFPMWHRTGIYFASDRDGTNNLFRYDLKTGSVIKITEFDEYDVKWPSLGPDAIVFENAGLLYTVALPGGTVSHIPVTVPSDRIEARAEVTGVSDLIRGYGISPSGKRGVFEARGDIFTVPAEHGSPRNLTHSPGTHELNPAWSPDGKWVAYLSDRTGEFEFYLRPQKGGDEVRITTDGRVYRYGPIWSPDSRKLLYWDKELNLWYVDIDKKEPVKIDHAEYRGLSGGAWSPDSRWIAYAKPDGPVRRSIFLYSLEGGEVHRVTGPFYSERGPVFGTEGKYLYFLSDRFFFPSGDDFDWHFDYHLSTGIFAVTLQADTPSPFPPRSDEEEAKGEKTDGEGGGKTGEKPGENEGAKKEKKKEGKKGKEEKEKKAEPKPVKVDLEGIGSRIAAVPVPPGTYRGLEVRKGKLYYASIPFEAQQSGKPHRGNRGPTASLHVYDLKKREDKVLIRGIDGFALDKKGKKLLYRSHGKFGIVDAAPGKAKVGEGALATSKLKSRVDPKAEWREIFHEAWRIERDFYWDPNMAGLDWEAIGKRYEALLPWVAHRSDLNYLIGEMIGELSTSHAYVGGGEMPEWKRVGVGLLGVDFAADGKFYRIARIYHGENWDPRTRSPLTEPGLDVHEGDYLLAVNGEPLRVPQNPYEPFQGLAGELVDLTINNSPAEEDAHTITVRTLRSEMGVRYVDWVESNRRKVDEATGGRVAYMHVPDTSIMGLMQFDKYLAGQVGKEAMIVDERYNHGGMIPDFYTEKLKRKLLAFIGPREGKDTPWPPWAIYGSKVMIINERAGSGGDLFPWLFKRQKIGKVVGMRTWGGLVGISRSIPMMDGGHVTAPEIGFWVPEDGGKWVVENYGVDPDVEVRQRPDLVVKGHDPQLEKAIELALEQLKNYPAPPPRPPHPKH